MASVEQSQQFAEGVGLFNRRAYFESHEVWEVLWLDAAESDKKFLGALIQIAAGLHLRFERGGGRGTRNLLVQALTVLEDYRPRYGGVDVDRLHAELATYAERVEETKTTGAGWLDRWLAPRIRLV
jgi:predicted metal-dependent hydrolase